MFDETFYWMLFYLKKGDFDDRAQRAYLAVATLQTINLASVLGFLRVVFNYTLPKDTLITLGISACILIILLNRFRLYSRRTQIFGEFQQMPDSKRRIGKSVFWGYIVLTHTLFIVFSIL